MRSNEMNMKMKMETKLTRWGSLVELIDGGHEEGCSVCYCAVDAAAVAGD